MKRIIVLFFILCFVMPIRPQTDWGRILLGAYKASQAVMLTDEDLSDLIHQQVVEMDKQSCVCDPNSKYSKRINQITKGMSDANGIKLNFKVYRTKEYNAFACPDGSVRVFSALMDILDDNELLGVIGHEIGHVTLRHSKKAWQDALLRSAVSDAIASKSSTWAGLSDSFLGDITSAVLYAKHSRVHETEADDYGYDFLKKSGKNPWAMGLAFKKLKAISKQTDSSKYEKLLEAFSSHPDFDERIKRMRDRAKKDGYKLHFEEIDYE